MGGTGSGRRTNLARRLEAARLRAAGLTFAQIGHVLGLTRQRVGQLLRAGRATRVAVRCRACGGVAASGLRQMRWRGSLLCPSCLARAPGVPFGEWLRTHRLIVGLTQEQLGRQAGVTDLSVSLYERGMRRPRSPVRARLVAVLRARQAERA